ncbi:MAG: chlorite dismutase family protein [Elusimicrobia bacterium]|nr:chlorite dismutase family protein [Elusimicrobiota bacterium]MDE2313861.1 chlorite dismutase family protein [Elusimicrobiota bacterium]
MAETQAKDTKKEAPAVTDLRERGRAADGSVAFSERRLFMSFAAFSGARDFAPLTKALESAKMPAALYSDLHDPRGAGLLAMSEDPSFFVGELRRFFNAGPFADLELKPSYSMVGRTYALGHEPNLDDWLVDRPRRVVLDPEWPWAVWYPLRRAGAFAALPAEEQTKMLREHGAIGHAFGSAGLGKDIRLDCHGIDPADNDFIIGLLGRELHPLSALVAAMRKTKQTSGYIEKMGPFFVGKAVWQSKEKPS